MKYSDLSPMEKEFLTLLNEAKERGAADYISIIALVCAMKNKDVEGFANRYSRGDHKRAVKLIRKAQKSHPEYADYYESAIAFIRKYWLRRDMVAA